MSAPTAEQQQAIFDFVEARSEDDIDDLQTAIDEEFPADVVEWWTAQWLGALEGSTALSLS
jgi:hypothetical protein